MHIAGCDSYSQILFGSILASRQCTVNTKFAKIPHIFHISTVFKKICTACKKIGLTCPKRGWFFTHEVCLR